MFDKPQKLRPSLPPKSLESSGRDWLWSKKHTNKYKLQVCSQLQRRLTWGYKSFYYEDLTKESILEEVVFELKVSRSKVRENHVFVFSFSNFQLFYCCSITVVCIFSPPLHPTPARPPPSPASTLPLGFVHVSFIVVPENPSIHYPFPPPLWLLLDCS